MVAEEEEEGAEKGGGMEREIPGESHLGLEYILQCSNEKDRIWGEGELGEKDAVCVLGALWYCHMDG